MSSKPIFHAINLIRNVLGSFAVQSNCTAPLAQSCALLDPQCWQTSKSQLIQVRWRWRQDGGGESIAGGHNGVKDGWNGDAKEVVMGLP